MFLCFFEVFHSSKKIEIFKWAVLEACGSVEGGGKIGKVGFEKVAKLRNCHFII